MFVQVTAKNVGGVFFETHCTVKRCIDTVLYLLMLVVDFVAIPR